MEHQYTINHYRSMNGAGRIWSDKTFLSLILLYGLTVALYTYTTLSLVIVGLSTVFLATAISLLMKRYKLPFVEITKGNLRYFDTNANEMVSLPLDEITQISTRFCELHLHTRDNTHTLNLSQVGNAKTRWEIKEMIRKMAKLAA